MNVHWIHADRPTFGISLTSSTQETWPNLRDTLRLRRLFFCVLSPTSTINLYCSSSFWIIPMKMSVKVSLPPGELGTVLLTICGGQFLSEWYASLLITVTVSTSVYFEWHQSSTEFKGLHPGCKIIRHSSSITLRPEWCPIQIWAHTASSSSHLRAWGSSSWVTSWMLLEWHIRPKWLLPLHFKQAFPFAGPTLRMCWLTTTGTLVWITLWLQLPAFVTFVSHFMTSAAGGLQFLLIVVRYRRLAWLWAITDFISWFTLVILKLPFNPFKLFNYCDYLQVVES